MISIEFCLQYLTGQLGCWNRAAFTSQHAAAEIQTEAVDSLPPNRDYQTLLG